MVELSPPAGDENRNLIRLLGYFPSLRANPDLQFIVEVVRSQDGNRENEARAQLDIGLSLVRGVPRAPRGEVVNHPPGCLIRPRDEDVAVHVADSARHGDGTHHVGSIPWYLQL